VTSFITVICSLPPAAGPSTVVTSPSTLRKLPAVPATTAVVLLSGGLDSATCLAAAVADDRTCVALSVRYGQRATSELAAAAALAAASGVDHVVIDVDLATIGGSVLTGDGDIPHDNPGGIPVTYVPARNTVLLALALGLAEVRDADEIWIGVNAVDYSGYPDCRPEFIAAFQAVADVATRAAVQGRPVTVRTPLLELSKAQIVALGHDLGVDFAATVSCYDPVGDAACGACDSCRLRLAGFADAGVRDPARYVDGVVR
jgi:7-cyano-7-deazaguanine synthase